MAGLENEFNKGIPDHRGPFARSTYEIRKPDKDGVVKPRKVTIINVHRSISKVDAGSK